MVTGRCNVACRLIMKAISKGSMAGCLIHLDASSTKNLAQQSLQIPEHVYNRTLPSWLLDASLSARDWLTSSRPGAILAKPLPTRNLQRKLKSPITPHLHQVPHPRQPSRDVRTVTSSMSTWGRYNLLSFNTVKIHSLNTN